MQRLALIWEGFTVHYQWNLYAYRMLALRRMHPEEFSQEEVDIAFRDAVRARRDTPLPAWVERMAEWLAFLITPIVAPFGTAL